MDIERWKFDIRQAMLDYGGAYKAGNDEGIRESSERGCFLVDMLAQEVADAIAAERERCASLCKAYALRHAKDDHDSKAQAWMMLQCAAEIRRPNVGVEAPLTALRKDEDGTD